MLRGAYDNPLLAALTTVLPGLSAAGHGVPKNVVDTANRGVAGAALGGAAGSSSNPNLADITIWHGSGYRFPSTKDNPLGEFDETKIGTGEGHAAFGWGFYGGQERGTGQAYRDNEILKKERLL
ncbi:MAG: hypothetical protein ACKO96_02495, partial [Flammeovirgaceae bacterium]